MSQQAVEGILGRLVTDEEFRGEFFRDPQATCESLIKDAPTPHEVAALAQIDRTALAELAAALDPKIVRAVGLILQIRHAA